MKTKIRQIVSIAMVGIALLVIGTALADSTVYGLCEREAGGLSGGGCLKCHEYPDTCASQGPSTCGGWENETGCNSGRAIKEGIAHGCETGIEICRPNTYGVCQTGYWCTWVWNDPSDHKKGGTCQENGSWVRVRANLNCASS